MYWVTNKSTSTLKNDQVEKKNDQVEKNMYFSEKESVYWQYVHKNSDTACTLYVLYIVLYILQCGVPPSFELSDLLSEITLCLYSTILWHRILSTGEVGKGKAKTPQVMTISLPCLTSGLVVVGKRAPGATVVSFKQIPYFVIRCSG